jgi:hypothetical protein
VFPAEDVVQLPVANTTVELIGEWLGRQLADWLAAERPTGLRAVEVEVEEIFGQSATCRLLVGPGPAAG